MSVEPVDDLDSELNALNINDACAVRALAQRLEAGGDGARVEHACRASRAVRTAVGRVRAEALAALLARDEARDEFIRRAADTSYMAPVELTELKVPRYVSIQHHDCACGATLMVPFPKHGGPGFAFDCPACAAPLLVRLAYESGSEYRATIELDPRPAKKRKRRSGVL